ncbi:MAG: hypothetical protein ACO3EE_08795 [Flavobacteriales bacterium]
MILLNSFEVKKISLLSLLIVVTTIFACKKKEETTESTTCDAVYKSQTAAGLFNDTSFVYSMGYAEEDFADASKYRFNLYGEAVSGDMCDHFNFSKPQHSIIFSIPKAVGEYKLGSTNSVTFNYAQMNYTNAEVATCGAIKITEITGSTISGSIDAKIDSKYYFNGKFTATLCK